MLSKKHLSNTDLEDDQQQQIYQQLSQLDLKLKSKPTSRQTHNLQKGWQPAQNKKEHHLKNWGNGKSESILTTYIPHMEYFSEICNQDIDQDSLFDCHNNFLGEHKLKAKENTSPSNAIHIKYPKSNNEVDEDQCSFGQKNIKDSLDIPQNSQILKQKTYIYKKQSVRPSNSTKRLPIQKSTNRSNEKKSLLLQKSRERQTDLIYRQNKKPTKSKQKYNLKQNPIEQQNKIQQSDLVKFSTFESFLSKAIEANSQEKEKPSKKSKFNKDQQSQISLQCTFKPSILKKSSQMVKSTKNVVQRLSTCNQSKEKKPYNPQPPKPLPNKQRIEQLSQPRKLKTQGPQQVQQTPSFRPSLSKKSLQQMRNCRYDVATRNQLWLQQKNQKLQRIKEEQELQKNKKQGCTYSPSICQYKGENDPRFSRFGKQGIANYFQRLSGANKNMTKSKGQQSFQNKQNKTSSLNEQQKSNYVSKGGKKPNYEQAVKQLHNRIMGLKI